MVVSAEMVAVPLALVRLVEKGVREVVAALAVKAVKLPELLARVAQGVRHRQQARGQMEPLA
jgi:hypothetical protein